MALVAARRALLTKKYPSWLDGYVKGGIAPILYADHANHHYWDGTRSYPTVESLVTATSGAYARTGTATDLLPSSVSGAAYNSFGANEIRETAGGILTEASRQNSALNSATPASQTITLATGTFTLWVNGSGSCEVAANTAVGSGFGTATHGNPITFAISSGGTVDLTVTGSLNAFQVENGPFGSSFIETAGTAVTRSLDNLYFGAAISSALTLLLRTTPLTLDTSLNYSAGYLSDGTTGNSYGIRHEPSVPRYQGIGSDGGFANQAIVQGGTPVAGTAKTAVITAAANDVKLFVSGSSVGTPDTSASIAAMTRVYVGVGGDGAQLPLFGLVEKVAVYNLRLTDAQIAQLA